MSNAAHDLADLLQLWQVIAERTTVRSTRGLDGDDAAAWRNQVKAALLLGEVDQYIQAATLAGRNMDHYARAYPGWAKGIFAPEFNWKEGTQNARGLIAQPHIDLLRALGDIMDTTQLSVSMSPETSASGVAAVDELLEALNDPAVSLRDAERRYVYELITSVRRVFEESTVLGTVDLVARVHELLGVMTMLAETLGETAETRTVSKKLLRAARRIVPYAKFGARATAGTIGVAADLLEITGG